MHPWAADVSHFDRYRGAGRNSVRATESYPLEATTDSEIFKWHDCILAATNAGQSVGEQKSLAPAWKHIPDQTLESSRPADQQQAQRPTHGTVPPRAKLPAFGYSANTSTNCFKFRIPPASSAKLLTFNINWTGLAIPALLADATAF